MQAHGWIRKRRSAARGRPGENPAAQRRERREIRSDEAEYVGSLWLLLKTVLNAFRHQRNPHVTSAAVMLRLRWGAQRLSASKESAPAVLASSTVQVVDVLNAFRHQRKPHRPLPTVSVLRRRCAQRLSASKESALHACTSAVTAS